MTTCRVRGGLDIRVDFRDDTRMDLGENKTVYTPEQVAITYRLAGVGTRFAAILLDSLLQGVLLLGISMLFVLLLFGSAGLGRVLRRGADPASPLLISVFILALFLVFWGYFVFWETIWNGQTPGKRACGIRVMREGGFPIDFRASFIRNIVRIVDALPMFYGTGALCIFISKDSKRLGDYAAGTLVVVDAQASDRRLRAAAQTPPPPPSYQVLGDPALLTLRAITREQFAVVEHYLSRRAELPAERAQRPRPPDRHAAVRGDRIQPRRRGELSYDRFLVELAIAYRNLSGT